MAVIAAASWYWDPTSVAADDGTTVICPTDITHPAPGRWLVNPSTHAQNTDTGTDQETFILDSGGAGSGPLRIAADAEGIAARNGAHSAYVGFIGLRFTSSASGDYINAEGTSADFFLLDVGGVPLGIATNASGIAARNATDTAYVGFIGLHLTSSATGDYINAEGTSASTFIVNQGAGADAKAQVRFERGATGEDTGIRWPEGGPTVEYTNDGLNWQPLGPDSWKSLTPGTDFVATAASASTLTMAIDHTSWIKPGMAVRWLAVNGMRIGLCNGEDDALYNATTALTGVAMSNLDADGCLYFDQVDDGAGNFHTDIYRDVSKTLLVGHTASYASNGAKAVIEDNTSGLGGTIDVTGYSTVETITMQWMRYGVVTAVTATLLTIAGPAVNEDDLLGLWVGSTTRVVPVNLFLPGSYSTATEADGLWTYGRVRARWGNARSHVARFEITAAAIGAGTRPNANLTSHARPSSDDNSATGPKITTAGTAVVAATISPENGAVWYSRLLEVAVEDVSSDAGDQDLSLMALLVME